MRLFKKKSSAELPKIIERRDVRLPSGEKLKITKVWNGTVGKAKNKGLRRNDNL
ncbi:hypothetical protein [Cohnella sp. JJ-181]|uniref:hypothetical protein n=1 Tax=Cohnella rhizoplanae TaxID=2974897 RepID=UPI0022FF7D49|nr:hypothetical protein [Cohnella sp. JJ-181]CAI6063084.1 hypothetical protein COHCIP112018_01962 [Cohnella sp. JJ-181]